MAKITTNKGNVLLSSGEFSNRYNLSVYDIFESNYINIYYKDMSKLPSGLQAHAKCVIKYNFDDFLKSCDILIKNLVNPINKEFVYSYLCFKEEGSSEINSQHIMFIVDQETIRNFQLLK